ncbi:hypothetical protein [Teredinibacter turnerae]|uniref:hypothetical protein n=1 Tax=Teredinibacter turnerae TaxID=2426 RepID=UPI0004112F34|nr:hypothetical protein [Teredinibacter turnerae]
MKLVKSALALAMASALLTACGGSDGGNSKPSATPTPAPTVSCNDGLPSFVTCTDVEGAADVYVVAGEINEDFTMDFSEDKDWRIQGTVTVGTGNITEVANDAEVDALKAAGVTLTIEPGVHVRAFNTAKLIVTRGSKIMAEGTAAAPITFSSALDDDFDGEGEWGGVVIQGFAPQYAGGSNGVACYGDGTTCNVKGEGGDDIGVFGGNIVDDNSGVIQYVRIAEGGLVAGPGNEVNGLTLQGVGYGTTIDHIQVHNNLDDGIEWFGGTVNVSHVVLTNNDDDDIDFDEGYVGNIQFALVVKNQTKEAPTGENDPRGIEANSDDKKFVEETHASIANVTIIGGPVNNNADAEAGRQPGMRLRGAVTANIYNTVVEGFDAGCLQIANADKDGDGEGTELAYTHINLTNVIGDCTSGFYKSGEAESSSESGGAAVTFDDAYAVIESVASLQDAALIETVGDSDFMFEQTDYIGAVKPGTAAEDAWWAGWTLPGTLSESVTTPPAEADFVTCASGICTIEGNIDEDYTLVTGVEWRIRGTVTVGSGNLEELTSEQDVAAVKAAGVTLTIQPGVNVRGYNTAKLIVTRGSKLMADGLPYAPITFSSAIDSNFDGEGEWGGIVVQGFAPRFAPADGGRCDTTIANVCNVKGEGGDDIGFFGGVDEADNSGVIRYVRIAEGGLVAGPGNEVNGLTLQGVGYNTVVDYVQVHNNLDDGIEWFGGTVNVKHVVLTNNDDDDIDFDEGYVGNIQYALVIKNQSKAAPTGENDPRGIEANSSDQKFVRETTAAIANVTIIGGPVNNNPNAAEGAQPGMRLRGAVNVNLFNSVVEGFDKGCIQIDDADASNVGGNAGDITVTTNIALTNVFGSCQSGFYTSNSDHDAQTEDNSGPETVAFDAAYALQDAAATLAAPLSITAVGNSGFAFDATDYVGAVKPGTSAEDAWWAGWTLPGTVD